MYHLIALEEEQEEEKQRRSKKFSWQNRHLLLGLPASAFWGVGGGVQTLFGLRLRARE